MEVICLEDQAFYALLDRVISFYCEQNGKIKEKWIDAEEAMHKLRITSKTTLQKLRDDGKIKFTHPQKKIILYDSESINIYLEKHSKSIL